MIENERVDVIRFLVERRGCRLHEEHAKNYGSIARTILLSQIFNLF